MEMLKGFIFAWLIAFSLATIAVAQNNQTGFISLDCGIPGGSNYTDIITGLFYTSDVGYVSGGVNNSISAKYQSDSLERPYLTLTSFPIGTKNCYTLTPAQGNLGRYLIRASFLYGDYDDGTDQFPYFDLYIGEKYWDTVSIYNSSIPIQKEIIHTPSNDSINVCLVKINTTTPFISALELRPLNITTYKTVLNSSMELSFRLDLGSLTNEFVRYSDDVYDRNWRPNQRQNTVIIHTTEDILQNSFGLPLSVMSTALTPDPETGPNPNSLSFSWYSANATDRYYLYFHFAEVVKLSETETREFSIYINDNLFYGPMSPGYLSTTTVYTLTPGSTGIERYDVLINKTEISTLPPLINAIEVFRELKGYKTDI
ncbi:putative leucine-rich repeat receptor-like protein kinase At2g19210 [Solanum dulcamara]|uniref:putative leucine-rich repeat receptor-like protein kinase At2g19210 n=1 Tax=Solanum dulcamara TaxID=45834 RepID=UPI002485763B|nr:putative leucine-rich repeat receptor-like protein kinase At2g19210 [Solanum dulcamara]